MARRYSLKALMIKASGSISLLGYRN